MVTTDQVTSSPSNEKSHTTTQSSGPVHQSSSAEAPPPIPPRPGGIAATATPSSTTNDDETSAGVDESSLTVDIVANVSTSSRTIDESLPAESVAATPNGPSEDTALAPSRSNFLRSASTPTLDIRPPKLTPRWLFAEGKYWTPFGIGDSVRLEEGLTRWEKEKGKEKAEEDETKAAPASPPDANPTEPLATWRVPVGGDHLFEVDLRPQPRLMHPVFWKAPSTQVRRGSWFFESSRILPCDLELTAELTRFYERIKPWTRAYAEELRISAGIGAEGEEKLKCSLQTLKGSYVIFSGSHIARIYQEGVSTRLAKTLLTAWAGEHGGGTVVIRGWDQAQRLLRARKGDLRKKKRASKSGGSGGGTTHGRTVSMSRKTGPLSSAEGTVTPKQHIAGDESPMPAGSAQPPAKDDESPEGSPSRRSSILSRPSTAQQADLWSSLTSRFSSWGYSPSSSSAQLTDKQKAEVAESFKEAQAKVQENGDVAEAADLRRAGMDPSSLGANITADTAREEATADEELDDEEEEWERERQQDEEDVELVLCWHGIGQKLADEWKKLEFSIAVTGFQSLVRARSKGAAPPHIGGPGFPGLAKGKRLVFLPVNWRATLNDFQPTKEDDDEHGDEEEHLDNQIGLDDIFGTNDSIPLARQITKNLLLDIPLFLSHHRQEVLRRCIAETNRTFALFCQRNPAFVSRARDKSSQPKVSMICHSLGAALAIDVLSAQPTWVDPYSTPADMVASRHLAYNTRSLFLVGSPAALFYYLQSRQLIARSGREFSKAVGKDEALHRPEGGQWGCLSVDRIWNVFNSTDPIATCLNGCVDSKYASKMPALAVDKVVNGLLSTLPGSSPDVYKRMATTGVGSGTKASASSASDRTRAEDKSAEGVSKRKIDGSKMTNAPSNGVSAASSARNLLNTWSKRLPGSAAGASDDNVESGEEEEETPDLGNDVTARHKSQRGNKGNKGGGKSRERDAWAEKWARRQEEKKAKESEMQAGKEEEQERTHEPITGKGEEEGERKDGSERDRRVSTESDGDVSKDGIGTTARTASATTELLLESASAALAAATGSAAVASEVALVSATTEGDGDAEAASKTARQTAEAEREREADGKGDAARQPSPGSGGGGGGGGGGDGDGAAAAADPPAPPPQSCRAYDRASARFLCLNPLGGLDYVLPRVTGSFDFVLSPAGQLLEYLGMLQAHAAYWSNESFADLVLASLAGHLDTQEEGEREVKEVAGGQAETETETELEGRERWRVLRRRMFGQVDISGL